MNWIALLAVLFYADTLISREPLLREAKASSISRPLASMISMGPQAYGSPYALGHTIDEFHATRSAVFEGISLPFINIFYKYHGKVRLQHTAIIATD